MTVALGIRLQHLVGVEARQRRSSTTPAISVTLVATNSPWVWKIGRAWSRTSSPVNRQTSASVRALDARLSWLSMAPLERPVVPEV